MNDTKAGPIETAVLFECYLRLGLCARRDHISDALEFERHPTAKELAAFGFVPVAELQAVTEERDRLSSDARIVASDLAKVCENYRLSRYHRVKDAMGRILTAPPTPAPAGQGRIEELIAKSSLGAPFAEPPDAELDIAIAELKRIEADDEERDPVNGQLVSATVGEVATPAPAEQDRPAEVTGIGDEAMLEAYRQKFERPAEVANPGAPEGKGCPSMFCTLGGGHNGPCNVDHSKSPPSITVVTSGQVKVPIPATPGKPEQGAEGKPRCLASTHLWPQNGERYYCCLPAGHTDDHDFGTRGNRPAASLPTEKPPDLERRLIAALRKLAGSQHEAMVMLSRGYLKALADELEKGPR